MKKSELIFGALQVPVDYLMLLAAGLAAYLLRTSEFVAELRPVLFSLSLPLSEYFGLVALVALFFIFVYAVAGLYRLEATRSMVEEVSHVAIASSAGIMSVILFMFLTGKFFDSRFLILAGWIFGILFVIFGRFFMRWVEKSFIRRLGLGIHKVLLIGEDEWARKVMEGIEGPSTGSGYKIVKHLAFPNLEEVKAAVGNPGIDEVILASPDYPRERVLELIDFCQEQHLDFKFVPNLFQTLTTNVAVDTFTGVPLVELKRSALDGWGRIIKRGVDIIGGIFGLILFAPVMALIAFLIKWDSRGPVIYKNERVGPKGKVFKTYKFRTMKLEYCVGPEYPNHAWAFAYHQKLAQERSLRKGPVPKVMDDPRRTRIGRFLERTSLDELPQFWNVMLGNMSLVGPRPHMPVEVAEYEKHHKKVFNIKSGLTGLAQISGRSDLDFEDEVKLDTYYIENWSFGLDLEILLKTPFVVLFRRHRA
ncbi:sugar transferase [Candidatus Azambacteria bacterium]|nr:sugar transferase [Candidatus Azambacteria bacterium]